MTESRTRTRPGVSSDDLLEHMRIVAEVAKKMLLQVEELAVTQLRRATSTAVNSRSHRVVEARRGVDSEDMQQSRLWARNAIERAELGKVVDSTAFLQHQLDELNKP